MSNKYFIPDALNMTILKNQNKKFNLRFDLFFTENILILIFIVYRSDFLQRTLY